jgi:uncharacterized membrane protein
MYDASEVLQRIDDHLALVLIFGGLSFGCLFVYFYETARLGFAHRCAPMTLLAVSVFVVHDGNFVINFDDWFNGYDHWLFKGFWAALVVTTCFELVFLWTIIKFGREEMAPRLSQRDFTFACLGGVVAAAAGWAAFKESIDDPLYLISFMLTIFWCLPSISTLYMRRGVRRGMSVRQLWAYCGMTLGYVLLTIVVFQFHAFWWIALCTVTLGWGVGMLLAVSRAPSWEPEIATPRGSSRVGEPAPVS